MAIILEVEHILGRTTPEAFQESLATKADRLMKLGEALAAAKLDIGEVTNFCSVLPIAAGRQELGRRAPGEKPRRYCRVRRNLPLANIAAAAAALTELANAQDKNGKARLLTAYDRISDWMLTEIWVLEDDRVDPYADAPDELFAPLDALTASVSTVLLEPFSYSEAR